MKREKFADKIRKFFSSVGYTCERCDKEIFDYPTHRLCKACEGEMSQNDKHVCEKCGRRTVTAGVCLLCKKKRPDFTRAFSPFVYEKGTAALVNRVKNGRRSLAYFFGEKMSEYLLENCSFFNFDDGRYALNDENALLILPVPMTKEDKLERGFNQAAELARVIADELAKQGIEVEFDEQVLLKTKQTMPQKQRSFFERAENVKGTFHVHKRALCRGRKVLLVDDIMTTGATGSECAARLFGAGASEVIFLTAASLPEKGKDG